MTNAERPEVLLPVVLSKVEWEKLLASRLTQGGHRWRLAAGGRSEFWPRFEGLNAFGPRLSANWEWKPGLGLQRPVIAAIVEGEWATAWQSDRGGWGGLATLAVRQRLGQSWLLEAGHDWRRFDARVRAFDRTGREWFGRVERQFGET